jgi:carbohydrate-selective porin OprB
MAFVRASHRVIQALGIAVAVAISLAAHSATLLAQHSHGTLNCDCCGATMCCDDSFYCEADSGCQHRQTCDACLWHREHMLGDWSGIRPELAEHGIVVSASLTQFFQGVASGGLEQTFRYGDKFDLYLGEQRLWEDPCNKSRYTKLFGYVGLSEPANSPFQWTGFLSVEAFGRMISRPNDRMGIAYFYNALNSDFQHAFSLVSPIGDVQGGEVYYNAEITPWFHLTADLQVVEPSTQVEDTALVLGLRAKINF